MARSNMLLCRSGLWQASTRARFSGTTSAGSESYLLDSITFACSSRAIVRYPSWIATTTSRPRRPLACSTQGTSRVGSCGQFCLERPHLGPEPQARWPAVARRLRNAFGWRPDPNFENYGLFHAQSRTPGAVFTPVRGGRTGISTSGVSFPGSV